jgi:hypothetical protein
MRLPSRKTPSPPRNASGKGEEGNKRPEGGNASGHTLSRQSSSPWLPSSARSRRRRASAPERCSRGHTPPRRVSLHREPHHHLVCDLVTCQLPTSADCRLRKRTAATPKSSCPENTTLPGLNWLKGQPDVVAKPDDDYPPWLWDILKPKKFADKGPGSEAEHVRRRKENRQKIRDTNFMKTQ